MNYRTLILVGTIVLSLVSALCANDWITAPSYYTHDPQSGERVRQYTPIGPFYTYGQSNYRKSGFRHSRSSIQVGQSADNLIVTEKWGDSVRPYGEWRFPYRPYSVPYPLWGPPYGGLGYGSGYGSYGSGYGSYGSGDGPYGSGDGQHGSGDGQHGSGDGQHGSGDGQHGSGDGQRGDAHTRPWQDGSYPPYRTPRRSDHEFYRRLPGDRPHRPQHGSTPLPNGHENGGT
ncbi:MAG: hypothetical protein ACC628_02600 [Pirellulaceae bacterium]